MLPSPDFPKLTAPAEAPVRVLLVEDDPISAGIVQTYLRHIAFATAEVHHAASAGHALGLLGSSEFDLVIADLNLPDSSGAATIHALVQAVRCPVIAITSDDDSRLREETLSCGAYDFVQKEDLTEAMLTRLVRLAAMQARTFRSLRDSEALKSGILDAAMDAMVTMDHEGRVVEFNAAAERQFGYRREAALGREMAELMVPQELRAAHREGLARYLATGKGSVIGTRIEVPAMRSDGSRFEAELAIVRIPGSEPALFAGTLRDINQRKEAEAALRDSEARFRSLSELTSDWFWQTDEQHRFVDTPSRVSAITGLGAAAYVGRLRWEVPGLAALSGSWTEHQGVLARRESFRDLELIQRRSDGSRVYLQISGEPIYHAGGTFKGYRGTAKDVTARKQDERLLRLEHAVTQSLAAGGSAATAIRDLMQAVCETEGWDCGRYFALDEAGALMRFEDAWSQPGGRFDRFITGSRGQTYQRGVGLIGRVWASGEPLWIKDASQDPRVAYSSLAREHSVHSALVFPVRAGERMVGVVSISSDEIREPDARLLGTIRTIGSQLGQFVQRCQAEEALRASEARFRALTELSSDWYWEQDADLRFVGTSGQSRARAGITAKVHIGLRRWELPRTEIVGQTWDEHRRVLEARQPFHDLLLRRRAADGEARYVSVDGQPIFDASGAFTGYRGVAKDITSRMSSELALRDSEARFRALTELSSDMYWEQDRDFRFTAVSGTGPWIDDARTRMLGTRRWDHHYINMTEGDWAAHRAELEAHRPFHDLELGRPDHGGNRVWVSVSGEPVFDAAGGFAGYRGVGKDISVRKREQALLALEHGVTLCLAEAKSAAAGLEAVLRILCESQGWPAGRYFAVEEEAGVLRFSQAWAKPLPGVEEFIARSRGFEYRRGHGLSGKVWQSGEPLWVKDVSKEAGASGSLQGTLQGGAFVFPITSGGRTLGVMSFSSEDVRDPDARLLQAVGVIGSQVGQFVMRKSAESEERRRAGDLERFRAAMDMAHDAIYLTDRSTMRFVDVNRVGCRALGYTREQLLSMGPHDVLAKSREDLECEYDAVIARGTEGIRTEAAYARKDGRTGWSELFRRALRSGGGWIIVTISRDITERKTEEGKLRRFRAALDAAAEPVVLVDAGSGAYLDFNEAACRTYGYSREELLKLSASDILVDRPLDKLLADYKRLEADPDGDMLAIGACRRKDGSIFPAEFTRRLVHTSEGPIIVATARDLTERLRGDHRQAAVLKYQERVARFGQLALAQRQPAELIERAVQAMLEALGAEAVAYLEPEPGAAALVARALVGVADAAAPSTVPCPPGSPMAEAMQSGARSVVDGARLSFPWARTLRSIALLPVRGESGVRGLLCAGFKTGNAFAAEELNFAEAVASVLSTALQRIDSENRLAYLAQFDPLTGLANRTLLADRFSQMIVQAKRRDVPVAVLFIDLDGFKTVNDTLGHAGGDELLKEVGRRLQATVRDGDTVARISGDEFAIVLADMAQLEDAALVAQKVIDRLAATVDIAGKEVFVTASVGIAIYPGDGADADTLIGAADAAMYRAKQSGRNTFQFFTAEINQRSRVRAQMGAELRRALEREEFALAYQPKIDLANRRVTGAEALLRWRHPTRGVVPPAEFIPVLEETGLIVAVGDWVLRRACEDLKVWQAAGSAVGPVAVNLSARQFRRGDLDSHIKALVRGVGIEASLIELEITESQLMLDPPHAIRVMRALRDAGMRIAIDDFGTGYSSLAYLHRFPVSALKIDRSFVKDMAKGKDDATIVRTIIEMAHSLGFTVVAEGVETEEQATFLRLLRCEQAQGYLFAKPMPAEDYVKLLSRA